VREKEEKKEELMKLELNSCNQKEKYIKK